MDNTWDMDRECEGMTLIDFAGVIVEAERRSVAMGMKSTEVALGLLCCALAVANRHMPRRVTKEEFLKMAEMAYGEG